jgi:ribosome-binding protein aMBF1 (putative translation factor)
MKGRCGVAKKKESRASAVMYRRYYKGKPEQRIAEASATIADLRIGDMIRSLREAAGLTQAELAQRVGTQPSQICRIEDADYDGHSVETLRRIAQALHKRLKIEFVPEEDLQPA